MRVFIALCAFALATAACPSGGGQGSHGSKKSSYNLKRDQTVCPEYRDLICLGGEICSMDSERGCRVCRCEDIGSDDQVSPDSNAIPPE